MKEYIEKEKLFDCLDIKNALGGHYGISLTAINAIPAADMVEVRQIRAFIDRLIAERDKHDLHSMRWEHYDCDRLLIEQMLDEIDGERKGGTSDDDHI